MALEFPNSVWMTTATTGTGTITLGAALALYLTAAEAGVTDGATVNYKIIDGGNFELGVGTYTASGTTLSRDTVTVSKIAGTAGTSKLTLSGTATVFLTQLSAEVVKKVTGSFTPSFASAGGTFSYASQVGLYEITGKLVHFATRIALNTSGNTLAGTQITLVTLPFAVANVTNYVPQFTARWQATTSSFVVIVPQAIANGTSIFFNGTTAAATSLSAINDNGLLHATNGSVIWVSGTYISA